MSFCSPYSSTVYLNSTFNIGPCWEDLLPAIALALYVALFCSLKLSLLCNKKRRKAITLNSKIIFLGFCIINITTTTYYALRLKRSSNFTPMILSLTLNTLSYVATTVAFFIELRFQTVSPGTTFFFFNLLDLFRISQLIRNEAFSDETGSTLKKACFGLIIISALISLFLTLFSGLVRRDYPESTYANCERAADQDERTQKYLKRVAPACVLSYLSFDWMTSLLVRGFKRELNDEDFYYLSDDMRVQAIMKEYETKLASAQATQLTKKSFIALLFQLFRNEMLIGAALKFFNDLSLFVPPIILSRLIDIIDERSDLSQAQGYILSVLLFVFNVVSAHLINHYFDRGYKVGIKLKVLLMDYLYKKALRISANEMQNLTLGEITNLMSVDSQNFLELLPFLNILWSAPLQIGLGIYFLYWQIGVSAFVGAGIMLLLMIPGNTLLVKKMKAIQKKTMRIRDKRMKMTNELLSSMKMVKLYAWEEGFKESINRIRQKEIKYLRKNEYLNCINTVIWNTNSIFVALGAFVFYTKTGGVLTSAKAFTSIALLNIIRFPMGMLPHVINSLIVANESLKRFVEFFNADEVAENEKLGGAAAQKRPGVDLFIENAEFFWDSQKKERAFSVGGGEPFEIRKGEFVMVVGSVGSGKSAFLSAALGELVRAGGTVAVQKSIAYVAQTPWIQNATVRENILFGYPFDKPWYKKVLDACCLKEDLRAIKGGEHAEIGEKGINLSGGQKQRVALARAIYSRKEMYLIDDTLSALDAHVARNVLEKAIFGLLKGKTIVFCTHSIEFLKLADRIVVLKDGKISAAGPYEALAPSENFEAYSLPTGDTAAAPQKAARKISAPDPIAPLEASTEESVASRVSRAERAEGRMIDEEKRELGRVKWAVYRSYFLAYGGPLLAALILATYVLRQASSFGEKRYVAHWSDEYNAAGGMGAGALDRHIAFYALISLGAALLIGANAFAHAFGALHASRVVGHNLLSAIVRAPMTFFDTTPKGRITNRFSGDVQTLDRWAPMSVYAALTCFAEVLAVLLVVSATTPWFLAALLPLGAAYYLVQAFFVRPTREIGRISRTLLSPVYSRFHETLDGTATVRAFRAGRRFTAALEAMVDAWTRVAFLGFTSNRWLAYRLEFLGSVVVLLSACLIVRQRGEVSAGMAGLTLSFALRFISALNWMVRNVVALESQIVSVERIMEYAALPPEAPLRRPEHDPPETWPAAGALSVRGLELRYRPELGLILRGLSFDVRPREKVGIVGRTGAGKSSLFNCVFRVNEATGGAICIDGVDIAVLGLHALRSKLTIIPQVPRPRYGHRTRCCSPPRCGATWTRCRRARTRSCGRRCGSARSTARCARWATRRVFVRFTFRRRPRAGRPPGRGRRQPERGRAAAALHRARAAAALADPVPGRGHELHRLRGGPAAAAGDGARLQRLHRAHDRAPAEHGDALGPHPGPRRRPRGGVRQPGAPAGRPGEPLLGDREEDRRVRLPI